MAALMEGRELTATELARRAGIAPQTASGHIARLATAGLLSIEKRNRHRYRQRLRAGAEFGHLAGRRDARDNGGGARSAQVPRQRSLDVADPGHFRRRQGRIDKGPLRRSRFPNADGDQRSRGGTAKLKSIFVMRPVGATDSADLRRSCSCRRGAVG